MIVRMAEGASSELKAKTPDSNIYFSGRNVVSLLLTLFSSFLLFCRSSISAAVSGLGYIWPHMREMSGHSTPQCSW